MTEVLSAAQLTMGSAGGFHRSASTPSLSSSSLLVRSASTSNLGKHSKSSRSRLDTRAAPPSPPLSPEVKPSALSLDFNESFDAGLCLDDEIYLPVYDYDTSSPDEYNTSATVSLDSDSGSTTKEQPSPQTSIVETPEVIVTAVDDNEIKHEPSRHVDYLSHEWTEEEIASSWRYMVGKRNMYEYSARLENASWRTWAKSKFNLSTISPKKLNWSKECDVTWLYGPLSQGEEKLSWRNKKSTHSPSSEERTSPPSNGSGYPMKPILKKRSMSEVMLQKSLSSSSLLKQATDAINSQASERLRSGRPIPSRALSDFGNGRRQPPTSGATDELPTALASGTQSPSCQKHITFNHKVQQCIAVEVDKADDVEEVSGAGFGVGPEYDDSSSDDGLLMMGSARPKPSRSSSGQSGKEARTIAPLPSTTLKPVDEPTPKRSQSFATGLTSFFLGTPLTSGSNNSGSGSIMDNSDLYGSLDEIPQLPDYSTLPSLDDTDDDEELAELNWGSAAFSSRRDSISLARPRFDGYFSPSVAKYSGKSHEIDYSYEEDEDDEVAAGLFGRAVDAVNTAKDIAHVIWNVGWRH